MHAPGFNERVSYTQLESGIRYVILNHDLEMLLCRLSPFYILTDVKNGVVGVTPLVTGIIQVKR